MTHLTKIQEYISCFEEIEQANYWLDRNLGIIGELLIVNQSIPARTGYMYRPAVNADLTNSVVREANSLIIDQDNRLLGRAFELPVPSSSIPDDFVTVLAETIEIPDGVQAIVYNCEGSWNIGLRPRFVAHKTSIKQLITSLISERKDRTEHWTYPFVGVNRDLCFVFIYSSVTANRVFPQTFPRLTLLSVVNPKDEKRGTWPASALDSFSEEWGFLRPTRRILGDDWRSIDNILFHTSPLRKSLLVKEARSFRRVELFNPLYIDTGKILNCRKPLTLGHILNVTNSCRDGSDFSRLIYSLPFLKEAVSLVLEVRRDIHSQIAEQWRRLENLSVDRHKFRSAVTGLRFERELLRLRPFGESKIWDIVKDIPPIKLNHFMRDNYHGRLDQVLEEVEAGLKEVRHLKGIF